MRGNVHLEKMTNKAEECVGKVMWMSRVNGQVKVDRWMMWELIGRQSVEHAAEVWWSGVCSACRNLESAQMRVGRRLLGASNTGLAVQGDLGWRKLEEKREKIKVLFEEIGRDGRELTGEDGGRETKRGWMNRVVGKVWGFEEKAWTMRESRWVNGRIRLRQEMRRTGKKKYIQKAHWNGIGWQKMIQGGEICEVGTGSGECEVAVQEEDWFSWVVRDKKICRIVGDERCVMRVREDVAHFLVGCGKFERNWLVLLDGV